MTEMLTVEPAAEPDLQAAAEFVRDSFGYEAPADAAIGWEQLAERVESLGEKHAAKVPGSAAFRYELGHMLAAKIMTIPGEAMNKDMQSRGMVVEGAWTKTEEIAVPATISLTVDTPDLSVPGGLRPLALLTAHRGAGTAPEMHGLVFGRSDDGTFVGETANEEQAKTMARMLLALASNPDRAKLIVPPVPSIDPDKYSDLKNNVSPDTNYEVQRALRLEKLRVQFEAEDAQETGIKPPSAVGRPSARLSNFWQRLGRSA